MFNLGAHKNIKQIRCQRHSYNCQWNNHPFVCLFFFHTKVKIYQNMLYTFCLAPKRKTIECYESLSLFTSQTRHVAKERLCSGAGHILSLRYLRKLYRSVKTGFRWLTVKSCDRLSAVYTILEEEELLSQH